jgi:predicted kinase
MYGHPVSGKTTTAEILATLLDCNLLQTFAFRQNIFGSGLDTVVSRRSTHKTVYSHMLQEALCVTIRILLAKPSGRQGGKR